MFDLVAIIIIIIIQRWKKKKVWCIAVISNMILRFMFCIISITVLHYERQKSFESMNATGLLGLCE